METRKEMIQHQDKIHKLSRREQEGMDEQQKLVGQKQAMLRDIEKCQKSFVCLPRKVSFGLISGSKRA